MTRTQPLHLAPRAVRTLQRGVTLIELMIAITLGMLVMAALLALFINVTRTNNEMSKANRQIENGRFAIQLLQNDLILAGFWSEVRPAAPAAIPDPCLAVVSWDAAYKANMLGVPVMGYSSTTIPASCTADPVIGAQISTALANSDVLVVRHANTCTFGTAGCDGAADTGPHIQVSSCTTSVPPEAAYVIDSATFPLRKKNCTTTENIRRKIVSNVYYVAISNNLPTLMRASLVNGAYTAAQPLVEGIEAFRVEYGIDTLGRNGLAISPSNPGDGSPDSYLSVPPTTLAQLANIVAVKVHVLARNLETTPGYTDSKVYQLGNTPAIDLVDDSFKRHVFSATVRLVNPSGRREVP